MGEQGERRAPKSYWLTHRPTWLPRSHWRR